MANKISGKIIKTIGNTMPQPRFCVCAWDDDWPDGDDFLGEDLTNTDGKLHFKDSSGSRTRGFFVNDAGQEASS